MIGEGQTGGTGSVKKVEKPSSGGHADFRFSHSSFLSKYEENKCGWFLAITIWTLPFLSIIPLILFIFNIWFPLLYFFIGFILLTILFYYINLRRDDDTSTKTAIQAFTGSQDEIMEHIERLKEYNEPKMKFSISNYHTVRKTRRVTKYDVAYEENYSEDESYDSIVNGHEASQEYKYDRCEDVTGFIDFGIFDADNNRRNDKPYPLMVTLNIERRWEFGDDESKKCYENERNKFYQYHTRDKQQRKSEECNFGHFKRKIIGPTAKTSKKNKKENNNNLPINYEGKEEKYQDNGNVDVEKQKEIDQEKELEKQREKDLNKMTLEYYRKATLLACSPCYRQWFEDRVQERKIVIRKKIYCS